jgi:hypothetical protein
MNYARSSDRKSSDSCWPLVRADGLGDELAACPNVNYAQLRPFDAPEQFLVPEPLRDRIITALRTSQSDERGKVEAYAALRSLLVKHLIEFPHNERTAALYNLPQSIERTDPSPDHTDPSRDAGEMTLERAIDKTVASIKAAFAPTPPEPSVHTDTPMDGDGGAS